jgi:hypothetical protein
MPAINLRNATHTPKSKSPSSKLRKIFTLLASFVLAIGAFGAGIGVVYATVTISQNIQIGSGTPDLTLDGDDLYVTGTAEVDGTLAAKTGGAATFVVAASDASDRVKNQADYVADGTADDVEIQAAIDALPAAGGKIVLSEGTFNIATAIKYESYVTIQGQGYGWQGNGATILKPSADVNIFDNTDDETKYAPAFIGFTINGDGPNRTTGVGIRLWRVRWGLVRDVQIYRTKDNGIFIDDDNTEPSESRGVENRIENVMLYQTGGDSIDLEANGSSDNLFHNVTIRESQAHGLRIDTGGNHFVNVHIYSSGNTAWEDNGVTGHGIIMLGDQNLFHACQSESNQLAGISLDGGANRNVILGCTFFNNNREGGATRYGVDVVNGTYNTISSNWFHDSQGTPTQSGLRFQANGNNNLAEGNTFETLATSPATVNSGTGNLVRDNKGHVTESSGTSTIPSAATSTTVTHGLAVTPAAGNCTFVGAENPTNDVGTTWIDTYTSTQMNLNVQNDPGASDFDVNWSCAVY